MNIEDWFIYNVILVVAGATLLTCAHPSSTSGERRWVFVGSTYVLTALSVAVWIVYAILHFVVKYW